MVVLKTEYSRGGRNAATVRMKMKNLLNSSGTEVVFKADDKMDQIDPRARRSAPTPTSPTRCTCSWTPSTTSSRSKPRTWATRIQYLEDSMPVEVVFYDGKAISVELPTTVVREITYTEPAVKGDTSGKVLKPAKLADRLRDLGAAVRRHRRQDRDRHAHRTSTESASSQRAAPVRLTPPDHRAGDTRPSQASRNRVTNCDAGHLVNLCRLRRGAKDFAVEDKRGAAPTMRGLFREIRMHAFLSKARMLAVVVIAGSAMLVASCGGGNDSAGGTTYSSVAMAGELVDYTVDTAKPHLQLHDHRKPVRSQRHDRLRHAGAQWRRFLLAVWHSACAHRRATQWIADRCGA